MSANSDLAEAIVALVPDQPTGGQHRVSNELAKQGALARVALEKEAHGEFASQTVYRAHADYGG